MELKIYEIESQGEKEWIAAYGMVHALQTYCMECSIDLHEIDEFANIKELPKNEWANHFVNNSDYDENDPDDNWKQMSFAEFIEGRTKPLIIAGTMYE